LLPINQDEFEIAAKYNQKLNCFNKETRGRVYSGAELDDIPANIIRWYKIYSKHTYQHYIQPLSSENC